MEMSLFRFQEYTFDLRNVMAEGRRSVIGTNNNSDGFITTVFSHCIFWAVASCNDAAADCGHFGIIESDE